MIDTHCHLDMTPFDQDRDEVISRALGSSIEYIISVGSDLAASMAAVEIARRHDSIYAAVGIHPHDAKDVNEQSLNSLRLLISRSIENKIVALGEIGLDYHYNHSSQTMQRDVFERLLAMAVEFDMPVIIHSREADEDIKRLIDASGIKRALFHCFSSDAAMAEWVISRGFSISFAGNVTFKKAQPLREVAAIIPDDRLMIETDAPYLTPEPLRGRRNEPSYIIHTARIIAGVRGVSLEDIDRITSLNSKRFFRFGTVPSPEIAYRIRDNLYLNITSDCSNECSFCVRFDTTFVKGHNLQLHIEPTAEELISAIGDPRAYREVVFCGLGEPTMRLEVLKETAKWIKDNGGRVRLNTNGLGSLINRRDILPELSGIVDSISISLNAQNAEVYQSICKPAFENAYEGLLDFIGRSKKYIGEVTVTVVDTKEVDVERCKDTAEALGVKFRIRRLDSVG